MKFFGISRFPKVKGNQTIVWLSIGIGALGVLARKDWKTTDRKMFGPIIGPIGQIRTESPEEKAIVEQEFLRSTYK